MKRLAFCLIVLVSLSGCGSFELSDSPFLRINRAQPKEGYLVAVQARLAPTYWHAFSSFSPEEAEVREAACKGLSFTARFRCVGIDQDGELLEKPDYVIHIEYDVVENHHFTGRLRLTGGVLFSGNREFELENDDPGEAAYEVRWGFRVIKSGESKPVFQSIFREERFQFWSIDVEQWMERYFSE